MKVDLERVLAAAGLGFGGHETLEQSEHAQANLLARLLALGAAAEAIVHARDQHAGEVAVPVSLSDCTLLEYGRDDGQR